MTTKIVRGKSKEKKNDGVLKLCSLSMCGRIKRHYFKKGDTI